MDLESCDPHKVYGGPAPNCTVPFTVFDHYTNTCVSAALIQFEDQENELIMRIIYGYVLPVLAAAVVLSNSIVILVLNQQKNKRASIEALLWMAVSSLMMSLSPLPFTIYYYNLAHYLDFNQTLFLCNLQKVCMEVLPFFFNTLVTLFTLLLGSQRFVAVHYPLESLRWCTQRMVRRYSKLIFLFAVLLTTLHSIFDVRLIYHFCILQGEESFWVARCFIGHSALTTAMGAQTFASIFDLFRVALVVVPSVLLFIVTILLIQTIRSHDDVKTSFGVKRHIKSQKSSQNTTIMLTVIIVLFMVARAPSTILIVIVRVLDYLPVPAIALEFVHDVWLRAAVNITLITLHPITFAVYMFMSSFAATTSGLEVSGVGRRVSSVHVVANPPSIGFDAAPGRRQAPQLLRPFFSL
ncbi:unnamed protein product [Caenorhabditis auriculariae]|uniref:G-protein coupled receptors family 1 profile domain-containing protein n=1 Tax=Caenorhabditis auriculariae TaxID=2777116 RepID=A0A8S1H7S7_9PELO|nr:unnamed protein product [Caenorhabditis auriculariae]